MGQTITDQQSEIVCMMEGKGEGDTVEVSTIIHNSSVREAKYLLEHFLDMAINFVSSTEVICTSLCGSQWSPLVHMYVPISTYVCT